MLTLNRALAHRLLGECARHRASVALLARTDYDRVFLPPIPELRPHHDLDSSAKWIAADTCYYYPAYGVGSCRVRWLCVGNAR